ncbi:MAG: hypothetical protein R3B72_16875 [Polyangiaceae bacterium]
MRASLLLAVLAVAPLGGCSTLAEAGGGDDDLPNARLGPFRALEQTELGAARVAPYAIRDDDDFPQDLGALDVDGDPATPAVWGFAAVVEIAAGVDPDPAAATNAIVRHVAEDGRSFARQRDVVLRPQEAWEGTRLGQPAPLAVEGEVWLYYAAEGGIGLARSSDGKTFTRSDAEPVLSPSGGWEEGAVPASPTVLQLPDGRFDMIYEVTVAGRALLGEATSPDGLRFTRVGDGPLLEPEGADAGGTASPCSLLATTAEGRVTQLLYYGARDEDDQRAIALAGRFDTRDPFTRATALVYGGSDGAWEPSVLRYRRFSLLFATQPAGADDAPYPAVAAAIAPATAHLGPPTP